MMSILCNIVISKMLLTRSSGNSAASHVMGISSLEVCFLLLLFLSITDVNFPGSAQKAEHNIYIWNRAFGRLVKILEGPKEGIMDLVVKSNFSLPQPDEHLSALYNYLIQWHPLRPIIASVSTSGVVYIWATNYTGTNSDRTASI